MAQAAVRASVDNLMRMPQFGERWGWHWLDVARYAESTGKDVNLGYEAVQDKMHIHDLHATIFHLLGLDHERRTYR